ncbi:uncharacterized protein LOC131630983 isoform X2 [Vicia villosa]|uniref:uncharacterized protein LOC131630983 isoform X2 n=1 Tax=Vicia villosa TaxID=3911 RepID=UPI00273A9797|nr:uncharacterized protein LOC131630983 isoform X2 [Vicia villosa]
MEVAIELDDDLFFANLSKEIALLIMDEDEDPLVSQPQNSLQAFSRAIHPPPQFDIFYEQALMRRESKGTGVFIPQATQPRRKNKKGRSNSYSKYPKQSQGTRMDSQVHNKNSLKQ